MQAADTAEENDLRYILNLEREASGKAVTKYKEMCELVMALGHDGKKYLREAVKNMRNIVSEVYSVRWLGGFLDRALSQARR